LKSTDYKLIFDHLQIFLTHNFTTLLIATIPPLFAITNKLFSIKDYFASNKANQIVNKKEYQKQDHKENDKQLIESIIKASTAVKDHINTCFSFLLGAALSLYIWPVDYRFHGFMAVLIIFVFIFNRWIVAILMIDLVSLDTDHVPKWVAEIEFLSKMIKKPHHKYTYLQMFSLQHYSAKY